MRSSTKSSKFRAFVPLVLNGKVVMWYFENGENTIAMNVAMRQYTDAKKTDWKVRYVYITFKKERRNLKPFKTSRGSSMDFACELYYTFDDHRVSFEDGKIPVIRWHNPSA